MKNPLSLESLIDWLKKQPPEKEYDYWDTGFNSPGCAGCQWLRSVGFEVYTFGNNFWFDYNIRTHELPFNIMPIVVGEPHTFGAALKRALDQRTLQHDA